MAQHGETTSVNQRADEEFLQNFSDYLKLRNFFPYQEFTWEEIDLLWKKTRGHTSPKRRLFLRGGGWGEGGGALAAVGFLGGLMVGLSSCCPQLLILDSLCRVSLESGVIGVLQDSLWVVLIHWAMTWCGRSVSGLKFASCRMQLKMCMWLPHAVISANHKDRLILLLSGNPSGVKFRP